MLTMTDFSMFVLGSEPVFHLPLNKDKTTQQLKYSFQNYSFRAQSFRVNKSYIINHIVCGQRKYLTLIFIIFLSLSEILILSEVSFLQVHLL